MHWKQLLCRVCVLGVWSSPIVLENVTRPGVGRQPPLFRASKVVHYPEILKWHGCAYTVGVLCSRRGLSFRQTYHNRHSNIKHLPPPKSLVFITLGRRTTLAFDILRLGQPHSNRIKIQHVRSCPPHTRLFRNAFLCSPFPAGMCHQRAKHL